MTLPRILLLSDLHLEMHDYVPQAEGYDLVVLAGDIHTRERGVKWARQYFGDKPVLYVRGNHEGYGTHWEKNLIKMRAAAEGSNIIVMEKDVVVIAGVRFLGATGWSTFELWPDPHVAMAAAGEGRDRYSPGAKDYQHIRTGGYRRILPIDTATWAAKTRAWLAAALAQPFDGPTVVITHHPPTAKSLQWGVREPLDATDANPWDDLVDMPGVVLWMHGHTHHPVDYRLGKTRMFSNPRGYPGQILAHQRDGIVIPDANDAVARLAAQIQDPTRSSPRP